jgi:glycosyltransferase involved in cell wall biosynthesis
MGTLVVVTDFGAMPETVLAPPQLPDDERTGWHAPPADANALAKAIGAALLLATRERDAPAMRARFHVEHHFSLGRMAADTFGVDAASLNRHEASATRS